MGLRSRIGRGRWRQVPGGLRRLFAARPGAAAADQVSDSSGSGRSPAVAAGLSFLWPGFGQLLQGRRLAALALAVPALLLTIVIAVQLSQGYLMLATSFWDPAYFVAATLVVASLGLLRIVAIGDAFLRASRGAPWQTPGTLFVAVLLIIVLASHGAFVAGSWAWYETSVSIQNSQLLADASPSPSSAATATPTARPTPRDTTSYKPYPTNGPTPTPAPTPNPHRITFLLVGIDFMNGRDHSLTDTLMLVSIDTSTEKVAIVSVPRDTAYFPLYYGGWVGRSFKINTLWTAAASAGFGSPDDPMTTLEKEIGYLVGIPVNYYAAIDLEGFSKMIDAMGGVDVVNPKLINDPSTGIVMGPGPVHLDGPTAMLYVRSREGPGDNDYTRSGRQQAVLVALERKVVSAEGLSQFGTLLSLAARTIATDFPLSTANKYVRAAQNLSSIENCVLGPPYSVHLDMSLTGGTWTSNLDLDRVANLSVEMFGSESRYYTQPGVVPAACNQ